LHQSALASSSIPSVPQDALKKVDEVAVFLDANLKEHEQRQKVVELTVNFNANVRPGCALEPAHQLMPNMSCPVLLCCCGPLPRDSHSSNRTENGCARARWDFEIPTSATA